MLLVLAIVSVGAVLLYRRWLEKTLTYETRIVELQEKGGRRRDGSTHHTLIPLFLIKTVSRVVLKDPAGDTMMTAINQGCQLSVSD